jgi:preprotein translocase subunit SecG
MFNILITFLTFVLIIISLFMVLVILMQRPNANAGMGAAFGGGVTESAFGAETGNILTKATRWAALAFFILCLSLYLMHISKATIGHDEETGLPIFQDTTAPAAGAVPAAETTGQSDELPLP